jgi:hypothetical protein
VATRKTKTQSKPIHVCCDVPCNCPATPETVDEFNTFWKDLVCDKRGRLIKNLVMKELADFSFLMAQVPKVYMHVTGGRISKPNTYASAVIACATDVDNEALEEILKDERERWEEERQAEPVTDTAYVKLGGRALLGDGRHIRVCVPEGEFLCVFDRKNELLLVDDKHPLPYDWRDTAVDATKLLLKQEAADRSGRFVEAQAVVEKNKVAELAAEIDKEQS